MKKEEKIRKTVTRISAGVIFAVLLVFTLQIGVQGNSSSAMGLSALTFGLFSPAVAATSPGSGGGGGHAIPCQSNAKFHVGYQYVNCGSCMSVSNHRGYGQHGTCTQN
jgi:hypothetical protein